MMYIDTQHRHRRDRYFGSTLLPIALACVVFSGCAKSTQPVDKVPQAETRNDNSAHNDVKGVAKSVTQIPITTSSTSVKNSASAAQNTPSMKPFVLPFDDASAGITHIGEKLNHTPAGKYGALTSRGGHFYLGKHRQKFWGVNITSSSAFPSRELAPKIAARLAKFGVNIVRFHHLESSWGSTSLTGASGKGGLSGSIDADALDLLDYFIAELKKVGIYSNLNLQTARVYTASDGLPIEIEQLDWKQRHSLTYVLPKMRSLEKDYARALLTHINPYTKLSYAQDPAVAIVEINNENSLLQHYFDGGMALWPQLFSQQLQKQWNTWLSTKYHDTSSLRSAWQSEYQDAGAELVHDGRFMQGIQHWVLEQHQDAQASAHSVNEDGQQHLKLRITKAGRESWHVQLNQTNLQLEKNSLYTLSFRARSATHSYVAIGLQQNYPPWNMIAPGEFLLAPQWRSFSKTFRVSNAERQARITISQFAKQKGLIEISDVSLVPGGVIEELDPTKTLEEASIPINQLQGQYDQQRSHDWMAFLRDLDESYWADMHSFLVDELKITSLAYGTIAALSTPSIQQRFGFIDGHDYWRHPSFPASGWSNDNWTVSNDAMVNALDNTLFSLSFQRVAGLPFTVSEYNHPYPNSYAAEGPLLIAAYASFQDWDGIYYFDYGAGRHNNWDVAMVDNFFNISQHPSVMANFAVAANIFRRGDAKVAQQQLKLNFTKEVELDILSSSSHAWNISSGTHLQPPHALPFEHAVALDLGPNPQGVARLDRKSKSLLAVSDTKELSWDVRPIAGGVVTLDSNKTCMVTGFIDQQKFACDDIKLYMQDTRLGWATVAITAQHGSLKNLDKGASILVVASGEMNNSKMLWKDERRNTLLRAPQTDQSSSSIWGEAPTLVEMPQFELVLPVVSERLQAWALDESGQRAARLEVSDDGHNSYVKTSPSSASLWYELEVLPVN